MSLKIYNSLTNKIEEFIPANKNEVNMYVCGPTVYNYIHIGNARPVIFFDMFKNYLTFKGIKVNYASNITDVDDKIINKALERNVTEKEITDEYEKAYFEDCARLGSNRPDFVPHATEYISEMQNFIQELIDKGFAYSNDGDVYFRIDKLNEYGILSNQNKDELEKGVRIDVSDKKENPLDFTLWKKTSKGIQWNSPFGKGRPGWHTECVCMINKIFNHKEIDVHGGGMDLKFPHHENEIAQANALYHNHLARYWMHVGRVNLGKEKMSKSLGNVIWVHDFAESDFMPYRLLIIASPYRNSIDFTEDLLNQYRKMYDKFNRAYKQACLLADVNNVKNDAINEDEKAKFIEFMDNDLNTANALTLANDILKVINTSVRSKDYNLALVEANTLKMIFDVFGVRLSYNALSDEDKQIYKNWEDAKSVKDFELADKYRNMLSEKGII
ncbi:MAG: cysteine--tRNA ligase [Acholeplasmatales bacterium]|nr:cysteine--tRNA ligase [Acholeplasmatales bacterium]